MEKLKFILQIIKENIILIFTIIGTILGILIIIVLTRNKSDVKLQEEITKVLTNSEKKKKKIEKEIERIKKEKKIRKRNREERKKRASRWIKELRNKKGE